MDINIPIPTNKKQNSSVKRGDSKPVRWQWLPTPPTADAVVETNSTTITAGQQMRASARLSSSKSNSPEREREPPPDDTDIDIDINSPASRKATRKATRKRKRATGTATGTTKATLPEAEKPKPKRGGRSRTKSNSKSSEETTLPTTGRLPMQSQPPFTRGDHFDKKASGWFWIEAPDRTPVQLPTTSSVTRIAKRFDKVLYYGTIGEVWNENDQKRWQVLYDDGDTEDLNEKELEIAKRLYKKHPEEEFNHSTVSATAATRRTRNRKQKQRQELAEITSDQDSSSSSDEEEDEDWDFPPRKRTRNRKQKQKQEQKREQITSDKDSSSSSDEDDDWEVPPRKRTRNRKHKQKQKRDASSSSDKGDDWKFFDATTEKGHRYKAMLDEQWESQYQLLVQYKNQHGTTHVTKCQTHRSLYVWTQTQRDNYKRKILTRYREKRLAAIGFQWEILKSEWMRMFHQLRKYIEQHGGGGTVPRSSKEFPALGQWVNVQRTNYSKGKISEERIDLLESIGFEWDFKESQWRRMYQKLIAYKCEYGSVRVSMDSKTHPKLGRWVTKQRRKCRDPHRIDLLNQIGFEWMPHVTDWHNKFELLVAYKQKHGTTYVPCNHPNKNFRAWVQTQQRCKEQYRIDLLNSIGFEWKEKNL